MTTIHRMTGYDKKTDRLAIEYDIPAERLAIARLAAKVPVEDEGALGSYPLDDGATRVIAGLIGKSVPVDPYRWFLEPFED
jgi:hypothetical protein